MPEQHPFIKTIKRKMSRAWLGYIGEYGITKIDNAVTEDNGMFIYCELNKFLFRELIKPYIFNKEVYQNNFIEWHKDVKVFWIRLDGEHCGDMTVHFASDDLENVYVFHRHIQIVYMVGHINQEHELSKICLRKFKWMKPHWL